MNEVTRKPRPLSAGLGLTAGATATLLVGAFTPLALAGGGLGLLLLAVALYRDSRRLATLGGTTMLVGLLAGGAFGPPVVSLVLGVALAVVAYDLVENAMSLGQQVGREAVAVRAELVHAVGSALVGVLTALIGYGLFASARGGQPLSAVVFMLLGVTVLLSALRV